MSPTHAPVGAPADSPTRAGRRQWLGLVVLALPTLMVSLDVFVMLLALPQLSVRLHASSSQQLWVMDVYGFMVAGFMMTMGTVGDRIGRRRLLLIAAAVFAVASVAAAYSPGPAVLIGSRALLGIAGAALTPSTLSLITTMFRDPRQRATAIGVWAGAFTVGAIIGPILGGVMLERFWWGSVLLLGLPAMILLLAIGPAVLPEYRDTAAGRLDLPSVALSLAAILPAVYGLKELAEGGWQPVPVLAILVGAGVAVVFIRRQRRLTDPVLDLGLFAERSFAVTLGAMFGYTLLSGGVMVAVAQFFQLVAGLSPMEAGLALAPGMLAAVVSFQVSPLLARRIHPAPLLAVGLTISAIGLLAMTQTASDSSGIPVLVTGFALASLGGGPLVTLGTNLVVGSAPPQRAGSAAAIAQTGNEFGYALGVAAIGSLITTVYHTRVRATLPTAETTVDPAARDTLAGAVQTAADIPTRAADILLAASRDAFTTGLHTAAAVAAALVAGLAGLLLTSLRDLPGPSGRPGERADPGHETGEHPSSRPRPTPLT